MRASMVVSTLAGLSLSCAAIGIGAANDVRVAPPMAARLAAATIWTPQSAAPDTLVLEARWNLPGADGRGELDSVTVNFSNLSASGWLRINVPLTSVAATLRQPIPAFDAEWIVRAQVCLYRRKQVACADAATPYRHTEPPLAPVTGLTLGATKVP